MPADDLIEMSSASARATPSSPSPQPDGNSHTLFPSVAVAAAGGSASAAADLGVNATQLKKRKITSFKITNILPSRPPSNETEDSGEEDRDDSRRDDASDAHNAPETNGGGDSKHSVSSPPPHFPPSVATASIAPSNSLPAIRQQLTSLGIANLSALNLLSLPLGGTLSMLASMRFDRRSSLTGEKQPSQYDFFLPTSSSSSSVSSQVRLPSFSRFSSKT